MDNQVQLARAESLVSLDHKELQELMGSEAKSVHQVQ